MRGMIARITGDPAALPGPATHAAEAIRETPPIGPPSGWDK